MDTDHRCPIFPMPSGPPHGYRPIAIAAHLPIALHFSQSSVPMGHPDYALRAAAKMPKSSPLKTLKHSPPLGPRQETHGYRMHRSSRGYHRAATPWGPHIAHSSLEDSYRPGPTPWPAPTMTLRITDTDRAPGIPAPAHGHLPKIHGYRLHQNGDR
ncbi:hypothetical protein L3556_13890 [Candidatus Synechococcus calcipolaris G9]|uniref:Uncharacterized protein n=1 Tax=Candidatus Synechococcus calcipolaris G9 TaxID=1497997 RepID=A0ABT6F2F2_9SYNE|nr:hypothetical protein [Candidatus Synechococcus calcipolaris]MDG2992012.1 hypothetical protein [Candidatus Synechococcus calcipolaris G9]